MAVGMVKPQSGVQADGNPHSISNPRQLSHLTLPPRVSVKGFLKCQTGGPMWVHKRFAIICTFTPFSYTEITCLGFKALGEYVLMLTDLRSSLQCKVPRLEDELYSSSTEIMVFADHFRSKITFRNQELSMCLVEKENTQLQYKFQQSNCLGSLTWTSDSTLLLPLIRIIPSTAKQVCSTALDWVSMKRL